jgi:hypothetical protein
VTSLAFLSAPQHPTPPGGSNGRHSTEDQDVTGARAQ